MTDRLADVLFILALASFFAAMAYGLFLIFDEGLDS